LEVIIAGEANALELAHMARGKLKSKIPRLEQALEGRVRDHHRFVLAQYLGEWQALGDRIRRMEPRWTNTSALLKKPSLCGKPSRRGWGDGLQPGGGSGRGDEAVSDFTTVGVVGRRCAPAIMKVPGRGSRARRETATSGCDVAAWAATRKKNCYLSAQFRRLAARRGVKRAVMAVAHTMLTIGYHMLKSGQNLPRTRRQLSGADQQTPASAVLRETTTTIRTEGDPRTGHHNSLSNSFSKEEDLWQLSESQPDQPPRP
jgi:transposase